MNRKGVVYFLCASWKEKRKRPERVCSKRSSGSVTRPMCLEWKGQKEPTDTVSKHSLRLQLLRRIKQPATRFVTTTVINVQTTLSWGVFSSRILFTVDSCFRVQAVVDEQVVKMASGFNCNRRLLPSPCQFENEGGSHREAIANQKRPIFLA